MATYTSGDIVWYELLTTDPEGARAFYPALTGWTTEPWGPEGYTMWVGAQGPMGGVMSLPAPAKAMGAGSFWQANIQVADLDATIAKVQALGGVVHHSEDVPTIGRLAVIADPQGAVICLYQPTQVMEAHDRTQRGEVSWHELYTTDHHAAFEFYRQIAGWEKVSEMDMGPMGTYVMWGRNGAALGGMMTMPPGMTAPDGRKVPPSWMYYVTTPDLDGALERAKATGARVLNGPMEVPGGQRIVQLMDPQGAAFALVTPPAG